VTIKLRNPPCFKRSLYITAIIIIIIIIINNIIIIIIIINNNNIIIIIYDIIIINIIIINIIIIIIVVVVIAIPQALGIELLSSHELHICLVLPTQISDIPHKTSNIAASLK